ncbi:hypothetical protein [Motiliproteus sp. SC1-56]|uniref:hypothetical protein n=1 Tax=Motiliproteus sp. SC1-56 TaxID=2799565 RepID=UPI001A8C041D|nr:hypothetical protein [Motiliproteus sp. SC1-56]
MSESPGDTQAWPAALERALNAGHALRRTLEEAEEPEALTQASDAWDEAVRALPFSTPPTEKALLEQLEALARLDAEVKELAQARYELAAKGVKTLRKGQSVTNAYQKIADGPK